MKNARMYRITKWLFICIVAINTGEVIFTNEKILQSMPEDDANPIVFDGKDVFFPTYLIVSGSDSTTTITPQISWS